MTLNEELLERSGNFIIDEDELKQSSAQLSAKAC